jgi:uncharacterized membrane protein
MAIARIRRGIEVGVATQVAYDQWRRFEDYPRFLDQVESVVHEGGRRWRWSVTNQGTHEEWRAEIIDEVPYERIAWRAIDDSGNAGAVLLTPLGSRRCWVDFTVEAVPTELLASSETGLGLLQRQVEGSLDRFKAVVEGASGSLDGRSDEVPGPVREDRAGHR